MRGFFRSRDQRAHETLIEIRAAQVKAAFRQLPIALAVNAVNATITAVVLEQLMGIALPFYWLGVVLVVTAGRCAVWLRYRRVRPELMDITRWSWLGTGCSLLTGSCWGLGGMILFPIAPAPGQIFLTFVIGGMCAGAVVMSASHLPSLLAFLLSASWPMAVLFFWQGTATPTALGAMTLVFAAALSGAGLHFSRFFVETLRLRVDLAAANSRLHAEIAEREATEEVLRQAQKLEAIGQLTGGISHDFNNLLTVIIGNLALAIRKAADVPNILPLLQNALQGAERGAALTQRLLAFARKQRLDPRSVDLNRLVGGMEDLLPPTLGDQVRIAISADVDLAPARVDANQLELAVLNMAINARDAMPEGGILRIELRNSSPGRDAPSELPPGDYVVLSISDTGTGMDEATLSRAFEPFFTNKDIGSGSGLGLPMVQGFARSPEAQSGSTAKWAKALRSSFGYRWRTSRRRKPSVSTSPRGSCRRAALLPMVARKRRC